MLLSLQNQWRRRPLYRKSAQGTQCRQTEGLLREDVMDNLQRSGHLVLELGANFLYATLVKRHK